LESFTAESTGFFRWNRGEAMKILEELRELSKQRYVAPYFMAVIHKSLGENDQAFEWLERPTRSALAGWFSSKWNQGSTAFARTRASKTCCAASASRRKALLGLKVVIHTRLSELNVIP
jgi:hypothetical protein